MLLERKEIPPDRHSGAIPLTAESSSYLLNQIINSCGDRMVCFDLDSTLIDNRPRTMSIMREFSKATNEPKLANAQVDHFPTWSAEHSMSLLGLSEERIDQIIDPYHLFWEERFFSSQYCEYDVAISGAVDFVNAVYTAGGIVHYITGRAESMRKGTISSLQNLGFPVPMSAHISLSMNSTLAGSDDDFKNQQITALKQASVVAAFDNEPAHINSYRNLLPDAISVHLHTDHSMRNVKLIEGVVSIVDFSR